jgi:hypothetical protein
MNVWAALLMSGVGSIWVGMIGAVAYRVRAASVGPLAVDEQG